MIFPGDDTILNPLKIAPAVPAAKYRVSSLQAFSLYREGEIHYYPLIPSNSDLFAPEGH